MFFVRPENGGGYYFAHATAVAHRISGSDLSCDEPGGSPRRDLSGRCRSVPFSGHARGSLRENRMAGPGLLLDVQSFSPGGRDAAVQLCGGHEMAFKATSQIY